MYPNIYGEDELVMMMGALHIEMVLLNAIGDWLEDSGRVEIGSNAEVNSPSRAEAFLTGSHVKRSRNAHQITISGLHILLTGAYERNGGDVPFADGVLQRISESVQFYY